MTSNNYCPKCGHRIHPTEQYCSGCGLKTGFQKSDGETIFVPPIHNIGFFNFDIDFSPYIESKRNDFKYDICACGYLNDVENEYCYMCGAKRLQNRLMKMFKNDSKPKFSMDNVLCECGAINSKDNIFCEMCGKQLKEQEFNPEDTYSNFNSEFKDSTFCFCGEENEKFAIFCKNCGRPLLNYGKMRDIAILCTCSKINEITSDFCMECGRNLTKQNSVIVCICGEHNPSNARFCQSCQRPLNPQRIIKTRIICSCGEILDWGSEFCSNCGKDIKRDIRSRRTIKYTVKTIKGILR